MDCSAEEPAIGRGPLCEVTLAELAREDVAGMEEPAAELGPALPVPMELAREYVVWLEAPAAELDPAFHVPAPMRCRKGAIKNVHNVKRKNKMLVSNLK